MKLLFIQGGSRVRKCNNNTYYVDGNFNNSIWKRYNSYCDELTVILRKCSSLFDEKDICDKLNKIDLNLLDLKLVDDVYSPKINYLNIKKKNKIKKIIEKEVLKSDKVIIRSIGNFYTNTALKYCKKYRKDYLIEVTGFAFEGLWYHSFLGKLIAIPRELKMRKSIRKSKYVVYVTNEELQKRYNCLGKSLGCSDVEITINGEDVLNNRKKKIEEYNENYVYKLGTAAFLNVKWKGQQDVIKVLHKLKKNGITNFKYELIGSGDQKYLQKLINKYNLQEQVKILGVKKHDEVFNWLNGIDIYIQPSYQEGLCRSIVEAMSVACPVICTDTGGNKELIDNKFIYKKGKIKELEGILKNIDKKIIYECAQKNFENAKKYSSDLLNNIRDKFYNEFINSNNN